MSSQSIVYFGNCEEYGHRVQGLLQHARSTLVCCNPHPKELQELWAWVMENRTPFQMVMIPYTDVHETYGEWVRDGMPNKCRFVGSLELVNRPLAVSGVIDPRGSIPDADEVLWPTFRTDTIDWFVGECQGYKRAWLLPNCETGQSKLREVFDTFPLGRTHALVAWAHWNCAIRQPELLEHLNMGIWDRYEKQKYPLGLSWDVLRPRLMDILENREPQDIEGPDVAWFDNAQVRRGRPVEFITEWFQHQIHTKLGEIRKDNYGEIAWHFRECLFGEEIPEKALEGALLPIPPQVLEVKIRDVKPREKNIDEFEYLAQNLDALFHVF
jgi:hypothetical protein